MSASIEFSAVPIPERTTPTLSFILKDENGAPVPKADLNFAKLTYYEKKSRAIINSREEQDLLVAPPSGIIIADTTGIVTWKLSEADTAIVYGGTAELGIEQHAVDFIFKWNDSSGILRGRTQQFIFHIISLFGVV